MLWKKQKRQVIALIYKISRFRHLTVLRDDFISSVQTIHAMPIMRAKLHYQLEYS